MVMINIMSFFVFMISFVSLLSFYNRTKAAAHLAALRVLRKLTTGTSLRNLHVRKLGSFTAAQLKVSTFAGKCAVITVTLSRDSWAGPGPGLGVKATFSPVTVE
jgi:hypothetical protein